MRWLEGALVGAFLIATVPLLFGITESTDPDTYEVIVIGAGISGISAADALTQMGYNTIALEAKDEVGGRLLTQPWPNATKPEYYLDKGASWIHGVKYNPIFSLVEKYDINYTYTILESNINSHMYYINGKPFTGEDKKYIDKRYADFLNYLYIKYGYVSFHPFQELTVDRMFEYNDKKEISIGKALDNYFIDRGIGEEIDKEISELYKINVTTRDLFRHLATYEFVNTWATDPENISAVHYDLELEMEGNEAIFPEGYQQLAKRLAQEIDYRTNHVVTKIDWEKKPIEVYVKGYEKPYKSKYVVSTLPLGVLKKSVNSPDARDQTAYVEFDPRLPEWKVNAINHIGMGTMNKAWLIFNQTFWEDDLAIQYISIMDDQPEFSFLMNAQESLGVPILLAFHSGELGEKFDMYQNKNQKDTIKALAIQELSKIYDGDLVKKSYRDAVVTDWSLDPFTGGSYSYPAKGSTPTDFYDLAREVDGKLFFAGEATEALHWGTVHGAYLSGIRAAEEVDFRYSWDRWHSNGLFVIAGISVGLGSLWIDYTNWRRNRSIALNAMGRETQVAWRGTALVVATVIIIAAVYFWLEVVVGVVPDIFDYLAGEEEDCYKISRLVDALPYMRLTAQEESVFYEQLQRCESFG